MYTVLVEGDDMNDPVGDAARSILDGHIVLSREIASKNHYPAIDVLVSASRVMGDVVKPEHRAAAGKIRELMAAYRKAEDLVNIGAYRQGANPTIDRALKQISSINMLLQQDMHENIGASESVGMMSGIVDAGGGL